MHINTESIRSFNDYISEQIDKDKNTLTPGTYRRLLSFHRNFNKFGQFSFSDLSNDMVRNYHNHLLKTMKNSTTSKDHKALNKYIRRAMADGLVKQNPYNSFKIPPSASRRIFLTTEELDRIRTTDFGNKSIDLVRDLFLFMCNTALEYSDLMDLKNKDIVSTENTMFIIKNRQKVNSEVFAIPLLDEAFNIIQKYIENQQDKDGFIFPRRSNQKINLYLKTIADLCRIEKKLTSITARHTYATLMLSKGLPLETISHILGHSTTKTTRVYAKLVTSKITADLERLNIK